MKEEALKLANEIVSLPADDKRDWAYRAYDMICKLVAELDKQQEDRVIGYVWKDAEDIKFQRTKPLNDEEITEILIEQGIAKRLKRSGNLCFWQEDADLYEFARAILKKASEK